MANTRVGTNMIGATTEPPMVSANITTTAMPMPSMSGTTPIGLAAAPRTATGTTMTALHAISIIRADPRRFRRTATAERLPGLTTAAASTSQRPAKITKLSTTHEKRLATAATSCANNRRELKNDRAELRRDIRSGASKDEIMKDRQEIRDDQASMRKTREELANDRARLAAARRGK